MDRSPVRTRDLDELLAAMTLDEKAALVAGRDNWSTAGIERLGIPPVRVTDGPNGARGGSLFGAGEQRAVCVPCGTALAASWDEGLVERVGVLLGEETRTKACRVLLAPTVNLHRSPLAGRNFECLSEDPLLAGRVAAAYVRGVQSQDVAVTVKHLAGNEAETERYTMDSVIDERALRELYLLPFEIAVREGGALGVMTAYNRLNGAYCTEDAVLLGDILRGEWGFEGIVMSDWFAVADTRFSPAAGLDLEMPGPGRAYGPALADAVRAGEVGEAELDVLVRRLLGLWDRLGALDDPPDAQETTVERPEHRALAREAAVAGTVLLRNDGVLPLDPGAGTLAVVGPNADRAQIMGGGSARLRPQHLTTPLEALRARFGAVVHERGCDIDRSVPAASVPFELEYFAGTAFAGEPVFRTSRGDGMLFSFGQPGPGVDEDDFSLRARATLTPAEDGTHAITLVQAGETRVYADGELLLDGASDPPPRGSAFIGMVSEELSAQLELRAGTPVELLVEYVSRGAPGGLRGALVGHRRPLGDDALERAVAAAAAADAAVVVVGTNDDWETEGVDRASMDLPGAQDELVERVLAAQPRTIVVVNAGAPVTMRWAERAPALLLSWFGGQEMAPALAAILAGDEDPGGRLPTTLPLALEHNPSYGNFPGENSRVRYGEGLLVGYRWYDARHLPVRFPFGHGLSYARLELGAPRLSSGTFRPGDALTVEVDVANTGSRTGTEVVQCYVAPAAPSLPRPPRELKGWAKVRLEPGERTTVRLELGDRAFAHWDPGDPEWPALAERLRRTAMAPEDPGRPEDGAWRIDAGEYVLRVGRSSADLPHAVPVTVPEGGVVA